MAALDVWLVANLLYYRSYFSAIPLSSYLLAGNLADFLPSVAASFRWCDVLFPASTAAVMSFMFRRGRRQKITFPFVRRAYFILLISSVLLLAVNFSVRGGFVTIYGKLELSAHAHASGTPLYTLFGTLYFDYINEQPELTEEQEHEIEDWLAKRPALVPVPDIGSRDNSCLYPATSFREYAGPQSSPTG